jgi:hypothetical protein
VTKSPRLEPAVLQEGVRHPRQTVGVGDNLDSPYDLSPEVALERIASHAGPLLVDLDESLYLSNSTEDFIDLARPALLAMLLLRLLEIVAPWRLSGGPSTRDVWRVQLVRLFFPWTIWRWRRAAPTLAQKFANRPLLKALETRGPRLHVVTQGFTPIVAPIVTSLGLSAAQVIAARPDRFSDRRLGKLQCAVRLLGSDVVRQSLVLTDCLQDIPLLQACAIPVRTVWPGSRFRQALSSVYLPGLYLARVKRPGKHYFRRSVLQEDYVLWVLGSVALATHPMLHVIGLLLLLGSFWAVYERGYVDNDIVAATYETGPTLSAEFYAASVSTPRWQPWVWSAALGVPGILALRWPATPPLLDYGKWLLVLIATYLLFKLFNRVAKPSRVWLYPVLQLARTGAFAALLSLVPIGAVAIAAQIQMRWVPYYIYRVHGATWPGENQMCIFRAVSFLTLAALLGIAFGWGTILNWTSLGLITWTLVLARRELKTIVSAFTFISTRPADQSAIDAPLAPRGPRHPPQA